MIFSYKMAVCVAQVVVAQMIDQATHTESSVGLLLGSSQEGKYVVESAVSTSGDVKETLKLHQRSFPHYSAVGWFAVGDVGSDKLQELHAAVHEHAVPLVMQWDPTTLEISVFRSYSLLKEGFLLSPCEYSVTRTDLGPQSTQLDIIARQLTTCIKVLDEWNSSTKSRQLGRAMLDALALVPDLSVGARDSQQLASVMALVKVTRDELVLNRDIVNWG